MHRQFDMDWLLRQSDDAVIKELHRYPAHFWLVEQAVIAQAAGRISIGWGMTPDTAFIPLPDDDAVNRFVYLFGRANRREIKTWNGLDMRHMKYHIHEGRQSYGTMDLLAGLWAGRDWLTQDILNFITLRDVKGATVGVLINPGPGMVAEGYPTEQALDAIFMGEEEIILSNAFSLQMSNEALPYRHQVAAGFYVLDRVPLKAVDDVVHYDSLRLCLSPKGIYASLVFDPGDGAALYFPFYWTAPEPQINTAQVLIPGKGLFAIDQMMACIWRDACVVREAWASERRGVKGATGGGKGKRENPLVLPRTVYRSTWGSAEDREIIEERTRSAHSVRACYPRLVEGFTPRKASERASEYGYPPPPPGHTFRRPHTRGEGEIEARARKVVCKGLFVAKIALGE